MRVSVLSGSEETEVCVCTRGSWAMRDRGLHHSSGLSLPHGPALGVGLHPRVNATLLTLLSVSTFHSATDTLRIVFHCFMHV